MHYYKGAKHCQNTKKIVSTVGGIVARWYPVSNMTATWLPSIIVMYHSKVTCCAPLESVGGVLISLFYAIWAHKWLYHRVCDAWPVWRQTYGYLPYGRKQIILLGDIGTCVWTTCPGSFVTWKCNCRDLLIIVMEAVNDSTKWSMLVIEFSIRTV